METRDIALTLNDCKNVEISGFKIDYDPIQFSQGEVVAIDYENKTFDVKIDNGYSVPDEGWVGNRIFTCNRVAVKINIKINPPAAFRNRHVFRQEPLKCPLPAWR